MKKILLIFLMSCFLCVSPVETFSDSGILLTNIETYSNGGEGDVGPPHMDKNKFITEVLLKKTI